MGWKANIETAKESKTESLSEPGYDGTRMYESGRTYGMSDYTARERLDGSGTDVYTRNDDSPKGYTHDFVSSDGKITKYHDFIMMNLNYEQILYATEEECLETATEVLEQSSGAKTLTKRMF